MANTLALGASIERFKGSSPLSPTTINKICSIGEAVNSLPSQGSIHQFKSDMEYQICLISLMVEFQKSNLEEESSILLWGSILNKICLVNLMIEYFLAKEKA